MKIRNVLLVMLGMNFLSACFPTRYMEPNVFVTDEWLAANDLTKINPLDSVYLFNDREIELRKFYERQIIDGEVVHVGEPIIIPQYTAGKLTSFPKKGQMEVTYRLGDETYVLLYGKKIDKRTHLSCYGLFAFQEKDNYGMVHYRVQYGEDKYWLTEGAGCKLKAKERVAYKRPIVEKGRSAANRVIEDY
jgi:hypothetical protein